ncbi:MAG: extracellular solute-binding protein, partial [Chloroflexi bacterium]|nr:extracellular solute-binding protein [Chloroflexota bacterium]
MIKRSFWAAFSVLVIVALLISGCARATPTPVPSQPTQAPSTAAPMQPTPTAAPKEGKLKVGMVTDVGGIDDKSFNATSWAGVERAIRELGIEGRYLESQQQTDYAKNITEFLQQDYDLIIGVGFLLGEDIANFAKQNPDTLFAIVDYAYDPPISNVLGLTFATDEPGFLAGYLAAGMTKTGTVGTFGGIEIPPVTIFMQSYAEGVAHYNRVHGTNVKVLGTDFFVGNFESTDDGRRAGESLMDEGADIIMPVAGPVGLGTAEAVKERGRMLIGVDTDWYVSAPAYKDILLTSVLKNMDVAVFEAIKQAQEGTFKGGTYLGTLANNGVGLAPFHEFEDDVPAELKQELETLRQDIIADKIWTGWGEKPSGATGPGAGSTSSILGEKVTITFWHPQAPDDFRGKLLQEIIDDFQAQYPEITVEATFQGNYTELYKKLVAAVASGDYPDCAVSYPSMISDYKAADAVIELDPYINDPQIGLSAEDLADIFPGYLAECRFPQYGNKYYAFPFTKSALGMWYNLDLIKAAGYSAPPKTWAEFEEQCLAITQKTGKKGYAYYEGASDFDGFLFSRGATQLNADQTQAVFNGPEGVEALALIKRLIDAGAAWKPEGQYADQAEFGKGNVAFTFGSTSGTYYYKQAVEQGGGNIKEWGQTIIPQADPNNPRTVLYGGSFCIFKTTE